MSVRDRILALALRTRAVPAPELGGDPVLVAEMSASDRDDWELGTYRRWKAEEAAAKAAGRPFDSLAVNRDQRARLVAWTLREVDGTPVFLVRQPDGHVDIDATEQAVAELARRPSDLVDRMFQAADELNLITPGAVKSVPGNSAGTPGA